MEKVLEQNQIDALFAAASGAIATEAPDQAEAPPTAFNFAGAGQISNEQMRAISTVNDLFARNLMHTLGAWLRAHIAVALVSGEQMPYSEFLGRVGDPTYLCSVRLEPLGALGILEVDLQLASPLVDILLGGLGKPAPVRELTDIEESILGSVVQLIVKELIVAWKPVGLQFAFEKRETQTQVARLMGSSEKTMCISFEVRMPEAQGVLNLCLPAVVLNAILRRLITDGDRPRRRSSEARFRIRELLGESSVGAVLQLAPMRMHARQLASLAPGDVLRLPVPKHAPAELRLGGLYFGAAMAVKMGEHRGARLPNAGALNGESAALD